MATINIAFSAGLESVYMLQKALEDGHSVNVCWLNVVGHPETCAFEMLRTKEIVDYFRSRKEEFKGKINDVYYHTARTHFNIVPQAGNHYDSGCTLVTTTQTQQWGVVVGMMKIRQSMIRHEYPTTWVGWCNYDTAEYSADENDITAAEYAELLSIPVTIGNLSRSDRIAYPFRAPLWDMSKKQIWDLVRDDLKPFIILNGTATFDEEHSVLTYTAGDYKKEQYVQEGIPFEETSPIIVDSSTDIGFAVKLFCGVVDPIDINLPQEARSFVRKLQNDNLLKDIQPFCRESVFGDLKFDFTFKADRLWKAAHEFVWPVPEEKPKEKIFETLDRSLPTEACDVDEPGEMLLEVREE